MKRAIVIGGTSGLGLSITSILACKGYSRIYVYGRHNPDIEDIPNNLRDEFKKKVVYYHIDLNTLNLENFNDIDSNVDTLVYCSGVGRVSDFDSFNEIEIKQNININFEAFALLINKFKNKIKSQNDFYTLAIGSIAGHVVSPLFSLYSSTKAAMSMYIQGINIELEASGCKNRILEVAPGSIKGTRFSGDENNLPLLECLSNDILEALYKKETLFIPNYDKIYKNVIDRYINDPHTFGMESYRYKMENNRIQNKKRVIIGYLSGTFDLFHIGHLNLLKRAKEKCDYLIVGVHESGSWKGKETFIPFDERLEIIKSIKYVDEADKSFDGDDEAWEKYHYNKLFVGSDYLGSERFKKYEEFFKDKGVEIVYFPYTKGTSSTQLRDKISKEKNK